ncbi:MAG: hypothetical protein AB7U05_09060 [Mangrovibacterium sp.]
MTTHRITLRTCDIATLEGLSASRASEAHATLKASLGKSKFQKVTIREYCADRGFDYYQVLVVLGLINPAIQTV